MTVGHAPHRRWRAASASAVVALIATTVGTGLGSQPAVGSSALSPAEQLRQETLTAAVDALRAHGAGFGFGHGGAQGLGADLGVIVSDVVNEASGDSHVRMHRTFAGLPVLGGDLVVHRTTAGAWDGASATFREPLALDLRPVIDATTATTRALTTANALTGALPLAEPGLVIDAAGFDGTAPALAWDVFTAGTQADGTPSMRHTYVDAVTGKVRFVDEEIETVDGAGESLYGGRVPLSTVASTENFELRDLTRGGNYVGDVENRVDDCLPILIPLCTSSAPGELFTDADNDWGNGSALDRQTTAVDAQYGAATTWDYFLKVHKRRGIANDGVGVYSRVHYGTNYANAFWNDTCRCMTFGDGDGDELGPLVSLDISGHEITHGLTSRTAALMGSGESGGLNEATSDIFGTMIEFYAKNPVDVGDYLIGEMPQRKNTPKAIRYMYRPSLDKSSPDCWSERVQNLGVHDSAGIGNHFFYLVAEGSKAKTISGVEYRSPTCNGDRIEGIGRDAAAAIWYRALTLYFTSATDYFGARAATLNAAEDLYGERSPQLVATAMSWDAVNVMPGLRR
ncbi:MAG: M4 family metallopeptidase [Sporichthya sp.]|nr:M4 family metallopeptidase [Sporichthya sp.]